MNKINGQRMNGKTLISPYIITFCLIIIGVVLSHYWVDNEKKIYYFLLLVLTLFLSLRCWQGTDYNMYRWLYDIAPASIDFTDKYYSNEIHGEFSWKLMMSISKIFGISFELIIVVLSATMMACLHRFISNYSSTPVLSLLISYPNLILVYFASGLRQGLVIAFFLGFLIDLIRKKKFVQYFALTCILVTLHSSAAIFLIFPFAVYNSNVKTVLIACLISLMVGLIPVLCPAVDQVLSRLPFVGYFFSVKGSVGISPTNVLRRSICISLIIFSYININRQIRGNHFKIDGKIEIFKTLSQIYLCGVCFYVLFISTSAAGSRFFAAPQMLEIVLIPMSLAFLDLRKAMISTIVVLFNSLLLWNVLSSFISERGYYNDSWLTYPYYSVFTSEEVVSEDRPMSFGNP